MTKIKIGVDIGGSNLRIGLIDSSRNPSVIAFYQDGVVRNNDGSVDIVATVQYIVNVINQEIAGLRLEDSIAKSLGVSAPGAYLSDGSVYPGTVPNIPELEKVKLFELFRELLGVEWEVDASCVNNDGVVQGLWVAQRYLDQHPEISKGKIVTIMPGTGFGAGGYSIRGDRAVPLPGPQQFFDVITRKAIPGEMVVTADNQVVASSSDDKLMIEQLATGRALGLLGSYYLSREVSGLELGAIAVDGADEMERLKACKLYEEAGLEIGYLIMKLFLGDYEKGVVDHKPDTEGTKIFILGGWLVSEAALGFAIRQIERVVNVLNSDVKLVQIADIISAGDITDHLGVMGAAMLSK